MSPRKKLLIAIGLFIGVSLLFIIMALIYNRVNNNGSSTDTPQVVETSYVDPDSGETVNTTDRTPEALESGPLILGTSKFITYGMSSSQNTYAVQYITDYASTKKVADNQAIKKLSIIVSTISLKLDPNSSSTTLITNIKINDSITEYMEITYDLTDGSDLVVKIYEKQNGTFLYNSPPIGYEAE